MIWASPDCATFSIAAISHHRRQNPETGNLDPVSDYAKFCDEVDQHVLKLIKDLNPRFYFIENPRGGMRKMSWMKELPRYTVTYCQYGDRRMKPTDIWTNHPDPQFKPMCKNGDSCHEKAPRGSRTGTQGLKGSKERSVIPEALCQHIVGICEKYIKQREEEKMELKIKTPTFPEVIEFNFQELKQEITERASNYANLVYSDDQIGEAKKDRATLNKFVKALSDERIKIKKECLKPYEDFEAKIKELDAIVNKAIKNIDSQIKAAEEQKKAEKLEQIQEYWESVTSPEHPLTLQRVMDARWLNSSTSMKSIQEEINGILAKYAEDIATLRNLPEFAFEAEEVYKSTLDLGRAVNEAHRLSEQAKRKAEYEAEMARRAEEQARLKAEAEARKQEEFIPPVADDTPFELPTEPLKETAEWISFRALLTTEDALALKDFFNSRNIEFQAI